IDKDELILTAKFSTYLYAVCKNLWLYQLEKQKKDNHHLNLYYEEISIPDSNDRFEKDNQQKQFWYYYEKLSDVCKKILRLYWLKMSVNQIAIDTGNTENFIRKRKYECKNRLVELILKNNDKI
ncbi:MAG: sigma-70 family RNA polymerase sigma factor, partial [Bacteroidales bacterium]|nr:sigma-70 family RNA polymerase sigma factor [Bacteroidales bacterium]